MLIFRPTLHAFVEADESRTLRQLEALGATDAKAASHTTIGITIAPNATAEQRLLARALVDLALRLDPLVREIQLDGIDEAELASLSERVPLEIVTKRQAVDLTVAVGTVGAASDLVVDAAGWTAAVGTQVAPVGNGIVNPVGPLAGAALGTGEIFKTLFKLNFPDAPHARRFVPMDGAFSFFDYRYDGVNPALEPFAIDATLVGVGGVGAGVIAALAVLGPNIEGRLQLVDHDQLSRDNLNRVTYARIESALSNVRKVDEAKEFLTARTANLRVEPHPYRFATFKRKLGRRRHDRRYDVVITGLDNDPARHEVQRELPRVLIDGATGRDANVTVERVVLGEWGCLGCTRQRDDAAPEGNCDELPDTRAPSVSFLSQLPGVLACGELAKEALGRDQVLRGAFHHTFIYPPNEDMVTQAAPTASCRIECTKESVLRAYRAKYRDASTSSTS
jgi:ThiF family